MSSLSIETTREFFPHGGRPRKPIELGERQREARLRCLAGRLHRLGERPLYEFLRELDAGADLWPRLERYAALNPDLIQAFDGDRLQPLRLVTRGPR